MAAPLTFDAFRSRCLETCVEGDPPKEAYCPIYIEEYDRYSHQAMGIVLRPPTQCNHELCCKCLKKIVSRRKFQDNANLCPFCRAVWFQAEYESFSAQSRCLVEEATNTLRANNFGLSLFVPEHPGETIPVPNRRDTNPVPPLERTRRPYTGTNRPHSPAARQSTASRNTQYRGS
ncbi:hypothetical protein BKA58DRAFT_401691 [Alternaria rosae]|uniref:uncharacterized protein n=1 Tax=Alternaria rosae TaxID=1187941 RepID=UPI001E8D8E77|nr:uncharacterized protein BKA58DRAFT_401691 [Alternaria rosae]KAH6870122.1 hypothetical protein BKA58DRAFT_401691 [Alternaria rosae]